MSSQSDDLHAATVGSSKQICWTLVILVPVFYVIQYSISSLVTGILRVSPYNMRMPFLTDNCCYKSSLDQAVAISTGLSFFSIGIVFPFLVAQRFWDYACSLTIIHVILSSIVMQKFPLNWQWWVVFTASFLLMLNLGTFVFYLKQRWLGRTTASRS